MSIAEASPRDVFSRVCLAYPFVSSDHIGLLSNRLLEQAVQLSVARSPYFSISQSLDHVRDLLSGSACIVQPANGIPQRPGLNLFNLGNLIRKLRKEGQQCVVTPIFDSAAYRICGRTQGAR